MPVTGATMKNEIIIDCGVEGGAWTLLGRRGTRGGRRFRVIRDEGAPEDFIDPADWDCFEFHHETAWVVGSEKAPTLFDEYSWHTFYPVRVHPDFAGGFGRRCKRDLMRLRTTRTIGQATTSRDGIGCATVRGQA